MSRRKQFSCFLAIVVTVMLFGQVSQPTTPVHADGFITFENGVDGQVIQSTIPGLRFTNTNGYDWVYGDWRTGNYNGKYPDGSYTSNGNFFAWLGPNQGDGRIDFTLGGATYLSAWISTYEPVTMRAYYLDGRLAATATLVITNTGTGKLDNLIVKAPPGDVFHYVIISGIANYWLIDDLSTDAAGVPTTRNPLVFIPGVMGSRMQNDPDGNGTFDEVWPNTAKLLSSGDDGHLRVLKLKPDGSSPFENTPAYSSVRVGDIIRMEVKDVYQSTINYFTQNGYTENKDFFVCPYDWRKSIPSIAAGELNDTLDKCIDRALTKNPGATKVNVLAHSMGGLVSRYYVSDQERAKKVQRLITLGTPYLGSPEIALGIIDGACAVDPLKVCITNPATVKELLQNFPAAYQIAPGNTYFQVYPDGYIRRDRDTNGDGKNDGYLSIDASFNMLQTHNVTLAQNARSVQDVIAGWNDGKTNGVEVVMMVGDQIGEAVGTIVEYEKCPWYHSPFGWGSCTVAYRSEPINGDGTVPLRSADMRNLARGVDLTGGVSVFYFKLEHGALAKDRTVLQLAGDIFESPSVSNISQMYPLKTPSDKTPISSEAGHRGILRDTRKVFVAATSLRTEPLPLNGRFISIDGPVEVKVFDSLGNQIGTVSDPSDIENLIPGASFQTVGSTTVIFLPNDSNYTLKAYGQQEASIDVRIQKIVDDQLTQTDLYDDLPVTDNSTATLDYFPYASVAGDFQLDQNGDGINDMSYPPSATLDGTESQDLEPPQTTISVEGRRSLDGWFTGQVTATLYAQDNPGGTGVVKLEYSLDGGKTVRTYTGPFTFEAETARVLLAKATDKAGNEEAPLSYLRVRPEVIYLPIIAKTFGSGQASLVNGDFESGPTGWTEYSTHGWSLIFTASNLPVTPHGGSWAVWLGGENDETSYIQQQAVIPVGQPYLSYWHWIASDESGCGYDFGYVILNGTAVDTYALCASANTGGWTPRTVNLSAYAGQSVSLQIRSQTDSSVNSNLFIDDVSFQAYPVYEQVGSFQAGFNPTKPKSR